MSARADARKASLPIGGSLTGTRATSWWAMIVVILNEAVVFASLLASYYYLRVNSVLWPPQGIARPELTLSSINTLILISSSIALQWGVAGIAHGNTGRMRAAFAIAFLLGAVFLGIQVYEYTQLKFLPQDTAYGTLFWGITGLHAAHVFVGLLMNAYVQLRAVYGHFSVDRRQAVENVALYWHFVDVVWIFIFISLFLSPYW